MNLYGGGCRAKPVQVLLFCMATEKIIKTSSKPALEVSICGDMIQLHRRNEEYDGFTHFVSIEDFLEISEFIKQQLESNG